MTPYIQQQLKKLCDNPNWYDDMLISWDKNPRNKQLQIREILQIPLSDITIKRYNITTMKKKDLIYIPHQDTWTEHFPNPGSNKNDYTLYLSDPQAQYNKLLRIQQKLRNKKK